MGSHVANEGDLGSGRRCFREFDPRWPVSDCGVCASGDVIDAQLDSVGVGVWVLSGTGGEGERCGRLVWSLEGSGPASVNHTQFQRHQAADPKAIDARGESQTVIAAAQCSTQSERLQGGVPAWATKVVGA